jgi:pyruvate/2-oxoglutarate dehydrogenase complex dihydrolipoamide acyltransferase (E2) component
MASMQDSSAQADILKALLDGVAFFAARAALFVVRGGALAGWQARGFTDDNLRGVSIDGAQGLAARAINGRARVSASTSEFDSDFSQRQGSPSDGNVTLLPLVVRDKVAAVLYCDAGQNSGTQADYSAVEVLTRFCCLWLEQIAGRKQPAQADADAAAAISPPTVTAAAEPTPPEATSSAPAPSEQPEASLDGPSAEDQELHRKAKRFAKLLVDEIKLYNQAKVAEGRQTRQIYKLLREDIEKSRATYDKRYSGTAVASAPYFNEEVVRILADNDRALLGSDFPG